MSRTYATCLIYTPGFCLSHIINRRVKQQQASSQNLVWHQDGVRCQLSRLLDGECPTQLLPAHQSRVSPLWCGCGTLKSAVHWSLLCPSAWSPPEFSIRADVAVSLSHLVLSRLIYPNLSSTSCCVWSHPRTQTRAYDWMCNKSSNTDTEGPFWLLNEVNRTCFINVFHS